MDPFSRKLFKKSDARERLSQMGGIVASSPELASTVQRFQVGGDVTGLPPELLNNPSVQRLAARQGLSPAEYLMSLSPEALAATTAQIEQQAARPAPMTAGQNLMGMVPSFDPAPMDDFAMEFGDAGAGFPMPPATPAEEVGLSDGSERDAAQERAEFYSGLPLNILRGMGHVVGLDPQTRSIVGSAAEDLTARGLGVGSSILGMPETGAGFFRQADTARDEFGRAVLGDGFDDPDALDLEEAARADAEARAAEREAAGITQSLTEDERAESLRAEPDSAPSPEPEPTETPERTVDPMAGAADETADELRQVFGVPSPDRAPKNRRERVEQELDLIKDVFGHRNKDEARERAMNLAMIGLSIAAGQSPNALTNIAQGALAGTQAMQRAQGAEREREDALRMQAYESVLGEEREDRQFGRQMQLEQIKARLRGSEAQSPFNLGTATGPLNQFFARVDQLETEFGNVENPLWEDVRDMPYAERSRVAREIALSETMPAFEGAVDPQIQAEMQQLRGMAAQLSGGGGDLTPAPSAGPQVVTTREQYDSLPSGALFIQDGQTRRKP